MEQSDLLIWMDLEMTGLDPERERIIEIATIITDGELRIIAEGPDLVIHQPDEVLDAMDAWNQRHHGESGLIEAVRASTLTEAAAERRTLSFLQSYTPRGVVPLTGNSIHQDRRFLVRYMPDLHDHLHYRNVDVSTIKELAARWYPGSLASAPAKTGNHRALGDIHDAIAELRYYRDRVFAPR